MIKLKVRKGDNVKVISGDDRGKEGNVIRVYPAANKLVVKGINLKKKHQKPTKEKKGGIVSIENPIHLSNVIKLQSAKIAKDQKKELIKDDVKKKNKEKQKDKEVISSKKIDEKNEKKKTLTKSKSKKWNFFQD